MEFKVVKEEKNPFYERKDVLAEVIEAGATPPRKAVVELLAKKYGCAEDCIAIDHLRQDYGSKKITVSARVYSSAQACKAAEPEWKSKRGTKKAGVEAKAEKPAGKKA